MQGYESKKALITGIQKTAALSIDEFSDVKEDDKDKFVENVKNS